MGKLLFHGMYLMKDVFCILNVLSSNMPNEFVTTFVPLVQSQSSNSNSSSKVIESQNDVALSCDSSHLADDLGGLDHNNDTSLMPEFFTTRPDSS